MSTSSSASSSTCRQDGNPTYRLMDKRTPTAGTTRRHAFPQLGDTKADPMSRLDILDVLASIWIEIWHRLRWDEHSNSSPERMPTRRRKSDDFASSRSWSDPFGPGCRTTYRASARRVSALRASIPIAGAPGGSPARVRTPESAGSLQRRRSRHASHLRPFVPFARPRPVSSRCRLTVPRPRSGDGNRRLHWEPG